VTTKSRKMIKTILRWTLALGCLGYMVHFFWRNHQEIAQLSDLRPWALVAMAGLMILGPMLYSWRFRLVIEKCAGKTVPFWPWFKIVILGRFLTRLAPQAGNVYRSVTLKKQYQVSYTEYVGSFFSFTWMDTCFFLVFALAVVTVVEPKLQIAGVSAILLLLGLVVGIAAAPIAFEAVLRRMNFGKGRLAWLHGRLSKMLSASMSALRDGRFMVKIGVIGAVNFVNMMTMSYLCFLALGQSVSLGKLALLYVVLRVSTHVVITPGNLGVRELAFGFVGSQVGIGMADGMLASMTMRIVSTLILLMLGTVFGGLDLLRYRDDADSPESADSF